MRKYVLLIISVWLTASICAQTSIDKCDLSVPTYISPYYFGPNAFPIPDMLDGTTKRDLRLEIAVDHFVGFAGDQTTDIAAKCNIPLFTDRVNLTLWMPIMEWYQNTLERQRTCRLQDTIIMKGTSAGDVYVSTDIWALQSQRHWVDLTIRAAIKSASGGCYSQARYYDSPGYFFDVTIAKPIIFKHSFFEELRFAGSGGFLCWQTDNGRQNDAVMYGAMIKLRTKYLTLSETFGGYCGWENQASRHPEMLAHDCPMSLKTNITAHYKGLEFLLQYQYGLQDYPFHQFRIGLAYNIAILPQ